MTSPDPESISWIRVMTSFGIILAMMAGLALGLKYLARHGILLPKTSAGKSRRLQIVESLSLDMRRRLVIVRHDDKEHLLLLGNERDLVVESSPKKESASPSAEVSS